VSALRDAGHDVVWTGEWDKDPGDAEILALAFSQGRVLVTLDKDFGELAIVRGESHSGIIRLVNFSATAHSRIVLRIIEQHESELNQGALITAEPGRLRVRVEPRD
jgi:predicted nuclease of predicted toxin-antitoxin system